ncbi:hypothetical protein OUZ56_009804 [Daphnia magna]|uniref:Uncharacterized protein n=1 Tax=Daphnia magna TaxID=35525 RepID=A0ABR0AGY2_9CRUS|nr:hypothetical protein OUZ56_009804 [Daphnia magna]
MEPPLEVLEQQQVCKKCTDVPGLPYLSGTRPEQRDNHYQKLDKRLKTSRKPGNSSLTEFGTRIYIAILITILPESMSPYLLLALIICDDSLPRSQRSLMSG